MQCVCTQLEMVFFLLDVLIQILANTVSPDFKADFYLLIMDHFWYRRLVVWSVRASYKKCLQKDLMGSFQMSG